MEYYTTSLQHILAELERVDLLIRVQVWRARQALQARCLALQNSLLSPLRLRAYDCRNDQRTWLDFERRTPAPFLAAEDEEAPAETSGPTDG